MCPEFWVVTAMGTFLYHMSLSSKQPFAGAVEAAEAAE